MSDYEIPDTETEIISNFLNEFTIVSESSVNEHLDILLMLKALPNNIIKFNLSNAEMYRFKIF